MGNDLCGAHVTEIVVKKQMRMICIQKWFDTGFVLLSSTIVQKNINVNKSNNIRTKLIYLKLKKYIRIFLNIQIKSIYIVIINLHYN